MVYCRVFWFGLPASSKGKIIYRRAASMSSPARFITIQSSSKDNWTERSRMDKSGGGQKSFGLDASGPPSSGMTLTQKPPSCQCRVPSVVPMSPYTSVGLPHFELIDCCVAAFPGMFRVVLSAIVAFRYGCRVYFVMHKTHFFVVGIK